MRLTLVAVGVTAVTAPLCAAPVTVSWTHPTSYSDGSTLAVADIATTTVEYSSGTTFGTVAGQAVVTGPAATTVIDRPPGSWCFRARTTVVAARGGQTSVPSNVACRSVAFPAPNPPTIIDVIIAWLRSIFARWA